MIDSIIIITSSFRQKQQQLRTLTTRCKTNIVSKTIISPIRIAPSSSPSSYLISSITIQRSLLSTTTARINNNNNNNKTNRNVISDYVTNEILQYNAGIPIEES